VLPEAKDYIIATLEDLVKVSKGKFSRLSIVEVECDIPERKLLDKNSPRWRRDC
jgi:hypothetical protein